MRILSVWLWRLSSLLFGKVRLCLGLHTSGSRFSPYGSWAGKQSLPVFLALFLAFFVWLLAQPATVNAAAPSKKPKNSRAPSRNAAVQSSAVEISSDFFELTPDKQRALWKGRVVVVREDMKVRCDVLVADYDQSNRLKKFTCKGNAHMQQAAGKGHEEREVWGEVARFDNDKAELTVSGSPQAREGKNTARGEKIIFLTRSDRLIVEKAVFHIEPSAGEKRLPRPSPVLTKEKK